MRVDPDNFSGFDLNLTVIFSVLYREKNLTRTAERLGVGQPAISGSLARLRRYFGDPLFVRTKVGVTPTAVADTIHDQLFPALLMIESFLISQATANV